MNCQLLQSCWILLLTQSAQADRGIAWSYKLISQIPLWFYWGFQGVIGGISENYTRSVENTNHSHKNSETVLISTDIYIIGLLFYHKRKSANVNVCIKEPIHSPIVVHQFLWPKAAVTLRLQIALLKESVRITCIWGYSNSLKCAESVRLSYLYYFVGHTFLYCMVTIKIWTVLTEMRCFSKLEQFLHIQWCEGGVSVKSSIF